MSGTPRISDEEYQQALKQLDKQIDEYCDKDGGCAPDFFRLTIHFRCIQIINKAIKRKEYETEIRFKEVIRPYLWYSSNMIHEIYTDLEEFFLKRNVKVTFMAFNPGSVVAIHYLTLTPAPDSFLLEVRRRIKEDIICFISWYTKSPHSISHSYKIALKNIMGPHLLYSREVYVFILKEIISSTGENITYFIEEHDDTCTITLLSPHVKKQD